MLKTPLKKLFLLFFLLPIFIQGAVGTITGTITSASTGEVIPYAGVTMTTAGGTSISTSANSSGVYLLGNLDPDSYTFAAGGPSGSTEYQIFQTNVTISSGATTTQNAALLDKPGSVQGRVTADPEGTGLAATVTFRTNGIVVATANCSSTGDYGIFTLPPDIYSVTASYTGRTDQSKGLSVIPGGFSTDFDFSLTAAPATISGTVTDAATTDPIDGALLSLSLNGTIISQTTTDSSGNYSFTGLGANTYTVAVAEASYQGDKKTVTTTAGVTSTINFDLEPDSASILGTVLDSLSNLPLEGAIVVLIEDGRQIQNTLTSSLGTYTFFGVAPGQVTVQASETGYSTRANSFIIAALESVTNNFSLDEGADSLSGYITDSSTTMGIVSASVVLYKGTGQVASAITGSNGSYFIGGLSTGNYTVVVTDPSYITKAQVQSIVTGTNTLSLSLTQASSSGTIAGNVVNSGATAVDDALILITQDGHVVSQSLTNSTGNYSIPNLAPGEYFVQVKQDGYISQVLPATVTTGTTTVNFTLQSGVNTISGLISDQITSDGLSGALALINISSSAYFESTFTDPEGNYSLLGVPSGVFSITGSEPDYVTASTGFVSESNIALDPVDSPPQQVVGSVLVNNFFLYSDRIHQITWSPSVTSSVIGYRLYSARTLLATYSLSDPFIYQAHNTSPNSIIFYQLYAVNSDGRESSGVQLSLK